MPQEELIYRLTAAGKAALSQPEGRLSRGFVRLLGVLHVASSVEQVRETLPFLTADELAEWCAELASQGMIETASQPLPRHTATGALSAHQEELFDQTVDMIESALDRAPPNATKAWTSLQESRRGQGGVGAAARMIAKEALNTTQRMTLHGYFAYASRRADGKTKPADFRILIVQDDHVQSKMANAIASKEGYRVALAHSLVAFRSALRAQLRPDLVLLDADMPDGDGFSELEALRGYPVGAKLSVMMLTGRADEASVARGVLLGATGYVAKPYSAETLLAAMRRALNLD